MCVFSSFFVVNVLGPNEACPKHVNIEIFECVTPKFLTKKFKYQIFKYSNVSGPFVQPNTSVSQQ